MGNVLVTLLFLFSLRVGAEPKPVVVFDMGMTLVDHGKFLSQVPPVGAFAWEKYRPGAFEYVQSLKKRGFLLGMMVNIPESWGKDQGEKRENLQASTSLGWKDESQPRFAWEQFDFIVLPLNNEERKGKKPPAKPNLAIYHRTKKIAGALSGAGEKVQMLYIGENPREIKEAKAAGYQTWPVEKTGVPNFPEL